MSSTPNTMEMPGMERRQRTVPIRWVLVAMLYALAAKDIAICLADWTRATETREALISLDAVALAPLMHILLAVAALVTGWIVWTRSMAPGNHQPLKSLFSLQFVILMFEIMPVVLCLILISKVELVSVQTIVPDPATVRVEQPDVPPEPVSRGAVALGVPAAKDEALWVFAAFLIYLAWDFVGDIFMRVRRDAAAWCLRLAASFVCAVVAWLVWRAVDATELPPNTVIAADAVLIGLFVAFHALKSVETRVLTRVVPNAVPSPTAVP